MAINILPPEIANQIAAGEVVNRPASAVKELLENAIDAKSTEITLIIKDAGRTLIEVLDNGMGMSESDAKKCFLPHATSKISREEDLRNLTTMGFRGEALSSIAAIAQVELKTKTEEDELASSVMIEGGIIKDVSKTTSKKGTDIKVKNIFFNVPARRNFLKTDSVENSHITDAFLRVAIINPDISFTFIRDSNIIYKLDKTNFKKRIVDIFGVNFNKNLLSVSEEIDVVKIGGFISTVDLTRKNKNDQFFFVNNRFMKNNYFANAIERAYQNLIKEKSYPVFFITLDVNPKNIDVNIHPTKTEVKFVDDKIIYSVLNACVRKVLGQTTLASTLDFEKKTIDFPAPDKNYNIFQPKVNYNSTYNPFAKNLANPSFDFSQGVNNVKVQTEISFASNNQTVNETNDVSAQTVFPSSQLLNTYIITQLNTSLLFINQHKASKKIIFEKLKNQKTDIIEKEKLLIPFNEKFSTAEVLTLTQNIPVLESVGFELQTKQDGSIDIISTPANTTKDDVLQILRDVINTSDKEEMMLMIAERLALKEGKLLSKIEITTLVSQLFKLERPDILPYNEKVLLKIDNSFLKQFLG